jgi:hypothetical protein
MGKTDFGEVSMTQLLDKNQSRLTPKRVHGRVVNVVAALLRKQLQIPNIYLNPKIPGVPAVDILAVDRGGSGDLHVVEIKPTVELHSRAQLRSLVQTLKPYPFHFKYLALPEFTISQSGLDFAEYPELFDEAGIGRIGILSFKSSIFDASSFDSADAAKEILRPERFLVRGEKLVTIEKWLAKAKPDMEVRI